MKSQTLLVVLFVLLLPIVATGQEHAGQPPPPRACDPAGKEFVCGSRLLKIWSWCLAASG